MMPLDIAITPHVGMCVLPSQSSIPNPRAISPEIISWVSGVTLSKLCKNAPLERVVICAKGRAEKTLEAVSPNMPRGIYAPVTNPDMTPTMALAALMDCCVFRNDKIKSVNTLAKIREPTMARKIMPTCNKVKDVPYAIRKNT